MTAYNGWKNYETWNVALWLLNTELYQHLIDEHAGDISYEDFVYEYLIPRGVHWETPDGVRWLGRKLDYDALDEMLKENSRANQ